MTAHDGARPRPSVVRTGGRRIRRELRRAVVFPVVALGLPFGVASAADWAIGAKAGALGQGAQGTVKGGFQGGVIVELRTSERYEFGIGYSYGEDGGAGDITDPRVTVQTIGLQARSLFGDGRVKPYADLGLGWYQLRHVPGNPDATKAMGGPLGAGAAFSLSDRANLRAGVEYHMIAAEPTLGTGNMEDYFWIGAAFTVRFTGP